MKLRDLLIASQAKLSECGIVDSVRDARLLLAGCLDIQTSQLNLLDETTATAFFSGLKDKMHCT